MGLDDKYINNIENVNFQPIFIIGIARSGTSILYDILAKSKCFNYVTVYHIMKYNQLLHNYTTHKEEMTKLDINESFIKMRISSRGTDNLKVSADSAEEYGFILYNKTSNISIKPKTLPLFIELAKKIQYISENDKPLLLKNPFDFKNILYIKKTIPNAKFIFIHRHPYDIINSSLRIQRYLLNETPEYYAQVNKFYKKSKYRVFSNVLKHFYSEFIVLGLMYTTLFCGKQTKHLFKKIKKLQKEDYTILSYEDLCQKPNETINKILQSFNIKGEQEIDYSQFIKTRNFPLDPYVNKMERFIYKIMKRYFDYFGYMP